MSRFNLYQDEFHPSPWRQTWREFKRSHVAMAGVVVLAIFAFIAFFGPLISPYDPTLQNTDALLVPPSWDASGTVRYVMGTDALGRDLFSRLIHGAQVTFGTSVMLVLIAMLVGVAIGVMAGMSNGTRASVINHLLDALMVIPTLLLAIIIVAILGTGLVNSMWAITLALIPHFVHHTRNTVRELMNKEYILAARLDGASKTHIFVHSLLPNMIEMLVVQWTIALSVAILDITALGFLNLGAQGSTIELGAILADSVNVVYIAPWNIALPGLTIFAMVFAVNVVGDGLRAALNRRLRH
ncbi:ABC transporter permease subunit [Alteromonas oceanisediminis]|uniref:ABC transporter permease subunit n=1 Tax=Alteromonas oceanisediminis TaxID=2836180 RepID=UPI001BD9B784|nr:ABC transporter permease subunit [Alteromonas oceanisediminis]MBT0584877.1 ABC transporter permease subunit [Alteromonas oceanisediminis]